MTTEYAELRAKLNEREKALSRGDKHNRRTEALASLERLRKGDVIAVPGGRRAGLAVVVDPGVRPDREPRPVVITESRWGGALTPADFGEPVDALGRIRLPKHVNWRSPQVRKDVAASLRNSEIEAPKPGRRRTRSAAVDDAELAALRKQLRAHPCHQCPDRESHARWAERYRKLRSETAALESKVAGTTNSLARSFDRIRALLSERGYLAVDDGVQVVTEHGDRLARLYSESDLLAAECLRENAWAGLDPDELAAVASTLVFESRRDSAGPARVPSGPVRAAIEATHHVWAQLEADERRHKLDRTREPDAGFAWPVYRWARGESLEEVLSAAEMSGQELSAGDFVRWCRQVIDMLDQIEKVLGPDDELGEAAHRAVRSIRRGVVALGT